MTLASIRTQMVCWASRRSCYMMKKEVKKDRFMIANRRLTLLAHAHSRTICQTTNINYICRGNWFNVIDTKLPVRVRPARILNLQRPQTDWTIAKSLHKLNRAKLSVTHVRKDHPHCTWLLKQVYQGTDKIHPLWQSNSQLHRLESKRHFAVSSQLRTSEDTAKEQHKQWTPCQSSCHHFLLHIFLKLDLCLFVRFFHEVPSNVYLLLATFVIVVLITHHN